MSRVTSTGLHGTAWNVNRICHAHNESCKEGGCRLKKELNSSRFQEPCPHRRGSGHSEHHSKVFVAT